MVGNRLRKYSEERVEVVGGLEVRDEKEKAYKKVSRFLSLCNWENGDALGEKQCSGFNK